MIATPTRELPVIFEGDVVVVGGSFGGVAAAARLARAGARVALAEPRTYLGREVGAVLRPWWRQGDWERPAWVEEMLAAAGAPTGPGEDDGEIPLRLDPLKLFLEDLLLGAGVKMLYASYAAQVLQAGDRARGVVIANKSGRQVLRAGTIIDATETALVSRLAGGRFVQEDPGEARYARTLDVIARPSPEREARVPEGFGLAEPRVRARAGARGGNHRLVELVFAYPGIPRDLDEAVARELEARRRSLDVFLYLREEEPIFFDAFLGGASHELHGRKAARLAVAAPLAGGAGRLPAVQTEGGAGLSLADLSGPLAGLWCLQEAARLPAGMEAAFLEPAGACAVGDALGAALASSVGGREAGAFVPDGVANLPGAGPARILEPDAPQRGRGYPRQTVPGVELPVRERGVLVAGGGTSGAAAAVAAAEEGARTLLLEMNPGLGGTGTLGGVPEYWFGTRAGFAERISAAVTALDNRLGFLPPNRWQQWSVEGKMHALLDMALGAGVEILFYTLCMGAVVEGETVRGAVYASPYGMGAALAAVTVDATGDGDLAAFAGAPFVVGAERDHTVMWYSLPQIGSPGLTAGGNFTSMCDVTDIEDYTRAILWGRRRGPAAGGYDHGVYLAPRESRHVRGAVVLTANDMFLQRRWPDTVNIFYANYDIKGKSVTDWNLVGLVSANLEVELPYRALLPLGVENLLVAGKAFSCDATAIPLARMQRDLENLGAVAGVAAAQARSAGVLPRALEVRALQERLAALGILPPSLPGRRLRVRRRGPREIEAWVETLDASPPLYSYNNAREDRPLRERIPFVEVCTAGADAVPVLCRALENSEGERQVRVAQALAMCGSAAGAQVLADRIQSMLGSEGLPERTAFILNTNAIMPDHAAMPDAAYLLYSLGMARDRCALPVWAAVAARLDFTAEDFRHPYKGIFYYVDALCYGAERLGDRGAIPMLEKLLDHPLLKDQSLKEGMQPDFVVERYAMLAIAAARALARCGGARGVAVLIDYLDDIRALFAAGAHAELARITGQDFGKDAAAYRAWLAKHGAALRPVPWAEPTDAVRAWGEVILEEE